MRNSPTVSVCIPTYNGAKYIRECLTSVMSQTLADIEILVVDDCSDDDTMAIVSDCASRDRRFRVIRNPENLGLVNNWNRSAQLAQGEWIKFVFQDDTIAPACLDQMIAAAAPDALLTICRRAFVFDDATREDTRRYYEQHADPTRVFGVGAARVIPAAVCDAAIDLLGVNCFGEPTAALLRRQTFARFGYFNRDLAMTCDLEYWLRVAVNSGFTFVPNTLATFRVHAESASARYFAAERSEFALDNALLIYEYLHNKAFEPVRRAAPLHDPPCDLKGLLDKEIASARRYVRETTHARTIGEMNPDRRQALRTRLVNYPDLLEAIEKKPGLWEILATAWRGRA